MNAPDTFLSLTIGGAEIRVPREAAVMAFLEQEIDKRRPLAFPLSERSARYAFAQDMLPPVGEPFSSKNLAEVYAGLTLRDNEPVALVLLPGDFEGKWEDAVAWAKNQGGALPSRFDALALWQNVKSHFKDAAYWTAEKHASYSDYAWYQYFGYGYQSNYRQDNKLRARAVRRVPL